MQRIIKEKQDI